MYHFLNIKSTDFDNLTFFRIYEESICVWVCDVVLPTILDSQTYVSLISIVIFLAYATQTVIKSYCLDHTNLSLFVFNYC